jgi:hypothetical protein
MKAFMTLGLLLGLSLGAPAAHASAIVDFSAYWRTSFASYSDAQIGPAFTTLPAFLQISCFGDAQVSGNGCGDTREISGTVASGDASFAASSVGGLTITNNADHQLFLRFLTDITAFDHGSLGIKIDDPASQSGSYFSKVMGPSPMWDQHSCSTTPSNGVCTVPSPDSSPSNLFLDLDPGESATFNWTITMTADITSVPEPATWTVLGGGLLLLASYRRARHLRG